MENSHHPYGPPPPPPPRPGGPVAQPGAYRPYQDAYTSPATAPQIQQHAPYQGQYQTPQPSYQQVPPGSTPVQQIPPPPGHMHGHVQSQYPQSSVYSQTPTPHPPPVTTTPQQQQQQQQQQPSYSNYGTQLPQGAAYQHPQTGQHYHPPLASTNQQSSTPSQSGLHSPPSVPPAAITAYQQPQFVQNIAHGSSQVGQQQQQQQQKQPPTQLQQQPQQQQLGSNQQYPQQTHYSTIPPPQPQNVQHHTSHTVTYQSPASNVVQSAPPTFFYPPPPQSQPALNYQGSAQPNQPPTNATMQQSYYPPPTMSSTTQMGPPAQNYTAPLQAQSGYEQPAPNQLSQSAHPTSLPPASASARPLVTQSAPPLYQPMPHFRPVTASQGLFPSTSTVASTSPYQATASTTTTSAPYSVSGGSSSMYYSQNTPATSFAATSTIQPNNPLGAEPVHTSHSTEGSYPTQSGHTPESNYQLQANSSYTPQPSQAYQKNVEYGTMPYPVNPASPSTADPIANISNQFNQLRMSTKDDASRDLPSDLDDQPLWVPKITPNGPTASDFADCPEDRAVTYDIYWYRYKDIPDFLACTKCYADHIQNSPLQSKFEGFKQTLGVPSQCRFNVPRMTKKLWPEAIKSNDILAVRDYMTKRLNIPDCTGTEGAPASASIKWFSPVENKPEGFIICEACYEDQALATPFGTNFHSHPLLQRDGDRWSCDYTHKAIAWAVKTYSTSNAWQPCLDAITSRLSLPMCEGKAVEGSSLKWFRPRRTIPDMCICEACFQDHIVPIRFGHEFEQIPSSQVPEEGQWLCDLSVPSTLVAIENAGARKDFSVWWNAANITLRSPTCTATTIQGGTWYTVAGGCDNFDVCPSCYAGLIVPNFPARNLSEFFEIAERDPSANLLCDLNRETSRFAAYVIKLQEALDRRNFSIFATYVRRFSAVPACPGMAAQTDRAWYGFADCTICPDCYLSAIEGTALDAQMPLRGTTVDPRATTCDMYSPRMRGLWAEACRTGDVNHLLEAAKHRRLVYLQTVPQIMAIHQMKMIKMQQAMHYGHLSVLYKGMDTTSSIMGLGDENQYGSSSLGWHDSWQGAESAKYFNKMQDGFSNNNSTDELMRVVQLEAQWRAVE